MEFPTFDLYQVYTEREIFVSLSFIFLDEESFQAFFGGFSEEKFHETVLALRSDLVERRATRLTPRRHAAPVPGNLKLVIIHQDKPRTDSLVLGAGGTFERRYRGAAAANEKEKGGRGKGGRRRGGSVVSRYRASCMEITECQVVSLALFGQGRGRWHIVSGTMI